MATNYLFGKKAIISGGTGLIGNEIVKNFLQKGASVGIISRNRNDNLLKTVNSLEKNFPKKVFYGIANVRSDIEVNNAVNSIADQMGGIDIVVNAASPSGGLSKGKILEELISEDALLDIDIKVLGYIRIMRSTLPYLRKNNWGRIINIGGLAAYKTGKPITTLRNICVSALTKTFADEVGPYGITVNCIHPGPTLSNLGIINVNRKQSINSLNRPILASEVANIVSFIASEESSAINGESIGCGGGIYGSIKY